MSNVVHKVIHAEKYSKELIVQLDPDQNLIIVSAPELEAGEVFYMDIYDEADAIAEFVSHNLKGED